MIELAPAFSFLLEFNRLNKVRQEDQGYLRDSAKNSRLEEACQQLQKQREERITTLLRGIANCWEGDKAPATLEKIPDLHLPAGRWTASARELRSASAFAWSKSSAAAVTATSGWQTSSTGATYRRRLL
jgi:hypothetical protein